MPLEIGLWRIDGPAPVRMTSSGVPLETRLEALIEHDTATLGQPLLLVGRQVPTDYGTFIDLLAVDADGVLHVLELKRDRTPREVVAQILDYGSWVQELSHERVIDIFAAYRGDVAFEQAFEEKFGAAPPEQLNTAQRLTVVASGVDASTERIVAYLNATFAVPINVMFFRYYTDDDREYLARTWLLDETTAAYGSRVGQARTREPWNGQDWYVSFGEEPGSRSWDDARQFGFVSAGGAPWFSKTLRTLPVGGRVFAYIPKSGYVGVGTVTGEAQPFDHATLVVDGVEQRMADLHLEGTYRHTHLDGEDTAEYVVPVRWLQTRSKGDAVREKGMFANQNSACKLRNKYTLDRLATAFNLEQEPGTTE